MVSNLHPGQFAIRNLFSFAVYDLRAIHDSPSIVGSAFFLKSGSMVGGQRRAPCLFEAIRFNLILTS
jgi:hypothetical protein